MVLLSDIFSGMTVSSVILQKCQLDSIDLVLIKYEGKTHPERPILKEDCWLFRKMDSVYATALNRDPDIYCYNAPTEVLEDVHEILSFLYSNSDGAGTTDHVFDTVEYYLKKRYKAMDKKFDKIGAEPISRNSVPLPYQMGSLDKLKPEYKEFIDYLLGCEKLFLSDKLDGVSALWYGNKLYTRGNGVVGNDISELVPHINGLTPCAEPVRGELVIEKKKFQKWSKLYTNPRNLVSAKVNSKSLSKRDIEMLNDISFVAYELVNSSMSPNSQYSHLVDFGFEVPVHVIIDSPTAFSVIDHYSKRREASKYSIDGLVIQYEKRNSSDTKKAFKMLLEEQIRETRVNNIEWRISRYGRYVPVALYDTVYIEGNRYHKALAFNADWVRTKSLGYGTKIKISRSGDVIPHIIDVAVDPTISPILPSQKYAWKWEGKNIVLEDVEGNRDVQIGRLVHFFETLGVPKLKEGNVTKLFDSGISTLPLIVRARQEDFIKIKGIGPKMSKLFYESIHNTLREIRIDRLMIASGLFKGLGNVLLRTIYRHLPDSIKKIPSLESVLKIPGFGGKRAEDFLQKLPAFHSFVDSLDRKEIMLGYEEDQRRRQRALTDRYYPIFSGKEVVFTGFLGDIDLNIEDFLWDHGATIGSTVNTRTLCVICYSPANISEKMRAAGELKIPVYTIPEFCAKYNIKIVNDEIDLE